MALFPWLFSCSTSFSVLSNSHFLEVESLRKATRVVKPYVDLHFFVLHPLKLRHTLPLPSVTAADRWVFLENKEKENHGKIFNNDHEVLSFARYRMAPT